MAKFHSSKSDRSWHNEDRRIRAALKAYDEANKERARCPNCGMPTVPDHEDLTESDKLCSVCYAEAESAMDRHIESVDMPQT